MLCCYGENSAKRSMNIYVSTKIRRAIHERDRFSKSFKMLKIIKNERSKIVLKIQTTQQKFCAVTVKIQMKTLWKHFGNILGTYKIINMRKWKLTKKNIKNRQTNRTASLWRIFDQVNKKSVATSWEQSWRVIDTTLNNNNSTRNQRMY